MAQTNFRIYWAEQQEPRESGDRFGIMIYHAMVLCKKKGFGERSCVVPSGT